MVEDFEENAVGVPRRTATNEFPICSSQRVQYCVVQFLIVCNEVHFITVHDLKRRTTYGFWVVWEGFNCASVCEVNLGSLGFECYALRQFMCEEAYAC